MFDLSPKYRDLFPTITDRDDWTYQDIPWMAEEYWQKLFTLAGEGNYVIIISSERTDPDGVLCKRGQVFFSPAARENFKAYSGE